jgi:hypothetical protein
MKAYRPVEPVDTIAPGLKHHYFTEQSPPNLVADYDAIGFAVDHCLVKFNIRELTKLVVECHLEELAKIEGYPASITDFDWDACLSVFLNNAVWDI